MHGSISDEVVKNLNKLINSHQTNKFRKAFNNLSTNHKNEYIEHVKAKHKGSKAMSGILNALKKEDASRLFNQLLRENKEFAFNTLDCIHPTHTLFKTLFSALDKNQYIEHVKAKPQGSSAMSGILNALKKEDASRLFNQLLQDNKEFAFNTLDCIHPTHTLFKTLFSALDRYKNEYIKHVKAKPQGSLAMSGILNALKEKEEDASRLFNQLLRENKEFAFNTLDCINPAHTLFKTLFSELDRYKNEYIKHVKAKHKGSSAMSGILNALKEKEEDASRLFNQLLRENKEFAFNTLDYIDPQYTLFKTLFNQLNPKEKEEYRVHLKTKSTAKAKYILRNFYSSNLEEICTVEPPAKRQCIIPFPGFAEFHNQSSNIVKEDSTVNDSSVPEEHTSLEGELTFLDSQINGGEPLTSLQSSNVNPLPEFSFSLSSVTLDEMVKRYGFNHNDHALSDLEEVYVEQPAKFHTYSCTK